MEENVDLDDDFNIKKDLNEEKEKQLKIKSSEEVDKPKNIKKVIKKIKKKKNFGTEKKEEEKNIKEDLDNSKNKTEYKINNNKDQIDNNNNINNEEKTGEKIKKVKKIVKKKIIKKKLTTPDDPDKISNQTTLTNPNLMVNLLNGYYMYIKELTLILSEDVIVIFLIFLRIKLS